MEIQHPEDNNISPFTVQDENSSNGVNDALRLSNNLDEDENEDYVLCPRQGCGEHILFKDLDTHVEMHEQEGDFTASFSSNQEGEDNQVALRENLSGGKRLRNDVENDDRHDDVRSKTNFGTKLSHALRNLEDVDIAVHEREERGGRTAQKNGQSAKSAWGKILKMPETSKGGTRRRSRSPTREPTASLRKPAVKRLGVSQVITLDIMG